MPRLFTILYRRAADYAAAKIAIFVGSSLSALIGVAILWSDSRDVSTNSNSSSSSNSNTGR